MDVYTPSRPWALYLADVIDQMDASGADPNLRAPLPEGVQLIRPAHNTQLQFLLDGVISERRRRLCGYVGEITHPTAGRGAATRLYTCGNVFLTMVYTFRISAFFSCYDVIYSDQI